VEFCKLSNIGVGETPCNTRLSIVPPSKTFQQRERRLLASLREQAADAQGNLCCWCGRPMLRQRIAATPKAEHGRVCTAEHLVPISRGGRVTAENIRAACRDCNRQRGDGRQ
jgi:5-methylcytosine-specific restriction endonuclease McrA